MQDGALVHEHDVHMIELIEKVVGLEYVIPKRVQDNIFVVTHSSFDDFLVNYKRNKLKASLEELDNNLVTYEITIKKE